MTARFKVFSLIWEILSELYPSVIRLANFLLILYVSVFPLVYLRK